jgi:hypothetical protein
LGKRGLSWSWSYGSCICNQLCNQCLSSLTQCVLDTTLCDKVSQWLTAGLIFISKMVSCNYVYTDVRFRNQCCIWFYYYYLEYIRYTSWVRNMVFNATLNNIVVISWRSVLLVEETGVTGENHRPAIFNYLCNQCISITTNVVSSISVRGEVYSIQLYVEKIVSQIITLYIPNDFLTGSLNCWTEIREFSENIGVSIQNDKIEHACLLWSLALCTNLIWIWKIRWRGVKHYEYRLTLFIEDWPWNSLNKYENNIYIY